MKKRTLTFLLTLAMVLTMAIPAFADFKQPVDKPFTFSKKPVLTETVTVQQTDAHGDLRATKKTCYTITADTVVTAPKGYHLVGMELRTRADQYLEDGAYTRPFDELAESEGDFDMMDLLGFSGFQVTPSSFETMKETKTSFTALGLTAGQQDRDELDRATYQDLVSYVDKTGCYEISLTAMSDDLDTITYAVLKVVAASDGKESELALRPFGDVAKDAYFYTPVQWAVEKQITNGTGTAIFSPKETCTRAQIITFLWRSVGAPEPQGQAPFTDVPAGTWYEKATAWAAEQGIVEGEDFSPNAPCTREMAVSFLWKQAGSPEGGASTSFSDVSKDAAYAMAVDWAVEKEITNGTSASTFSPNDTCTRAQIVTFLWRYLAN